MVSITRWVVRLQHPIRGIGRVGRVGNDLALPANLEMPGRGLEARRPRERLHVELGLGGHGEGALRGKPPEHAGESRVTLFLLLLLEKNIHPGKGERLVKSYVCIIEAADGMDDRGVTSRSIGLQVECTTYCAS